MNKQIQSTTNYKQFKRVVGNRPINIDHVNHLIELNAEHNIMWQFPATISKDGYIFDGQHRLAASEAQGWSFYYTILELPLEDLLIAKINLAQRGWVLDDFIHFYAERGDAQYQYLEDSRLEHKISSANLLALLGNGRSTLVKGGDLKLFSNNEEKGALDSMIEGYLFLKPHIEKSIWGDRDFVKAIRVVFKQFSAVRFLEMLIKSKVELYQVKIYSDYLRQFENIFNRYKHGEKNLVRFF